MAHSVVYLKSDLEWVVAAFQ